MKRAIGAMVALIPAISAYAFEPTGEVMTRISHVKFNDREIIGPRVSMMRRDDGSWGGWLRGRPIDITVTPDAIKGVDLTLYVERNPDYLVLHGYYEGKPVHIEWPTEGIIPTWFWYSFKGQAALPNPPIAQFLLALLAVS